MWAEWALFDFRSSGGRRFTARFGLAKRYAKLHSAAVSMTIYNIPRIQIFE